MRCPLCEGVLHTRTVKGPAGFVDEDQSHTPQECLAELLMEMRRAGTLEGRIMAALTQLARPGRDAEERIRIASATLGGRTLEVDDG